MSGTGIRTFLAVVIAAFAIASAQAAQAPRVTIHELKTNWKRYGGRVIELRGQTTDCTIECMICPEDMTRATYDRNKCLPLAFSLNGEKEYLDYANRRLENARRALYMYATITITAKFRSECLVSESGKSVHDIFCTDFPTNLNDALVVQVHSRKDSRGGLLDGDPAVLIDASPADQAAMLDEFRLLDSDLRDLKFFTLKIATDKVEAERRDNPYFAEGVGCACLQQFECDGYWPALNMDIVDSPTSPYKCWAMKKIDKGWRVIPNFNQ